MTTKPKSIRLVYGVCYTNPNFLCNTVRSLLDGIVKPSDIVIAEYGPALANSLKKKDHVSVIKTPNYGMLSSLYAILEKYGPSPSVHIILVDEATTYMPHLAADYLNTTQDMANQLRSKLSKDEPFTGVAFGLGGIVFKEDKQNDLDNELNSLLDNVDADASVASTTLIPSIIQETTTVTLLELTGSIYLTADFLKGFKEQVFTKPTVSFDRFQAAVILSKFLEKQHVHRINICHLANNRFVMDRIGCFSRTQQYQLIEYVKEWK